jgi:1,2-dihydroxy-3-keto-5-methylthiopentene dioxygenase
MSRLSVYSETEPGQPLLETTDFDSIAGELGVVGVGFERWKAEQELPEDADPDTIIAAYRNEIDRLVGERGYQTFDVVSMRPDHPEKDAFRRKFLEEHTHSEDEVRFFVRGQGLFVMHIDDRIYSMLCERDDLISVPANTRHWFDMGPNPSFTAIRLFNNPEGWVANFTGDGIAGKFPRLSN